MTNASAALQSLLKQAQRSPVPGEEIVLTGQEPILPTNFLLGTAGQAAIAAVGLAAADLWRLRTGRQQQVSVDLRAATAAVRSDRYMLIDGAFPPARRGRDAVSGFYKTRDGRWVQLHCNFPHHRDGVLRFLGVPNDRAAVAAAVAGWDAKPLEDGLALAGMCAGIVRSRAEWLAHPQGQAVARLPVFDIVKLGDSQPEQLKAGRRPLSGVRVVELTRVIAGPVGGKALAEHGAAVLQIRSPNLPNNGTLDIDTGIGKLSAHLDLRQPADWRQLRQLAQTADIFLQSYRPGALVGQGFSPQALAELRPGIICATLSAYGHEGPWRQRRGFDTLLQSTTGFVDAESEPERPRHLPAQTMDYVSGYLLAFGAMIALARRAREGGSYLVRVSLAQTGHWIHELGKLGGGVDGLACPDLKLEDVQDLMQDTPSQFGSVRHVAPAAQLAETPGRWELPPAPEGSHPPQWPE